MSLILYRPPTLFGPQPTSTSNPISPSTSTSSLSNLEKESPPIHEPYMDELVCIYPFIYPPFFFFNLILFLVAYR